jgi:hypothetical protein
MFYLSLKKDIDGNNLLKMLYRIYTAKYMAMTQRIEHILQHLLVSIDNQK